MELVQDFRQTSVETDDAVMTGVGGTAHWIKFALAHETEKTAVQNEPDIQGTKTNFDKITEMPTSYEGINVCLYRSRETGLKVLIANVEMPLVYLTLVL